MFQHLRTITLVLMIQADEYKKAMTWPAICAAEIHSAASIPRFYRDASPIHFGQIATIKLCMIAAADLF